ncbi:hypothetical protein [Noviherbaspirillum humi]|uniref:hypothetical protein n=1 Tax=Noviherbaspirillum humi TaxID=1688639 RepID=UPI0011606E14|nr:hypothetical protein [Noviherbaspirillum humi]
MGAIQGAGSNTATSFQSQGNAVPTFSNRAASAPVNVASMPSSERSNTPRGSRSRSPEAIKKVCETAYSNFQERSLETAFSGSVAFFMGVGTFLLLRTPGGLKNAGWAALTGLTAAGTAKLAGSEAYKNWQVIQTHCAGYKGE